MNFPPNYTPAYMMNRARKKAFEDVKNELLEVIKLYPSDFDHNLHEAILTIAEKLNERLDKHITNINQTLIKIEEKVKK